MKSVLIFFLATFSYVACVHAELGGTPISGSNPAIKSIDIIPTQNTNLYLVRKLVTTDEVEIHEYISSGVVFAVTWQGENKPNLVTLLGRYYSQYAVALSQPASGRNPVSLDSRDLIIHTGGRMNSYFGNAFLPQLAPVGIQYSEIR